MSYRNRAPEKSIMNAADFAFCQLKFARTKFINYNGEYEICPLTPRTKNFVLVRGKHPSKKL
ncbi:hypothetical protein COY31_00620 [Candidatus Wolfebacteria bacterium CG_4_10_14_0_2_um_filter_39_18]|uniref:Uncharacterized protein n=1 Tax=Candidatus Wolfebacteria bacterium CG_4_10_14_0_2_um_filter_39_18 TaxID=1975061 RepID=A0A2M7TGT4_9BACT|nr:MAG: hypothetical protein COY31_00620 [Candidatus Wolfebacteria bacterium CG_4_10_14_0_2_um_filter_39_18]